MMIGRKIVCLLLIAAVAVSGCGSEEAPMEEDEIVLLEPLDTPERWEAAARRSLYDAKVYSAAVYPYTEEYAFEDDVVFDRFCAYPGERVERRDVLAKADSSELEEEIEKKQEQILEMEEEFREYREEMEEALYESRLKAEHLEEIVEGYLETEPEEYLQADSSPSGTGAGNPAPGTGADNPAPGTGAENPPAGTAGPVENPAYAKWKKELEQFDGEYRTYTLEADRTEEALNHRTRLFELDCGYARKQLARMRRELEQRTLVSSMEGSVVAVGGWSSGRRVGCKEQVIAIGDMNRKLLKCQYINKSMIAGAKDVYAVVDGKRYEVIYQPMDAGEYARLSALNETIVSVFELAEEAEEISVGDFAVITVVQDIRENVLSVPESAIHRESGETFVYVMQDGENAAVNVEIGMGDGVYREILSGIEEGDRVLTPEAITGGEERAVVQKGDFRGHFSGRGYLYYPSSHMVQNPVKYGRVYFVEYAVSLYEHVEEGDVIATIRVQQDEVALERNRVKLARLEERLAILEQEGTEGREKIIADRQEEIAKVRELLEEMTADSAATQIRAAHEGIVMRLAQYEPEDMVAENAEIAEIAAEDTCYVILEDSRQLLQYGNQVRISYTDGEGVSRSMEGMAATLAADDVGNRYHSGYAWILLPPEAVGAMAAAFPREGGGMARVSYGVEADIRQMEHVLLVPRQAVWEVGDQTYVLVVQDGDIVARSFIAGGFDASNYWVVDGLTEGTELCLK